MKIGLFAVGIGLGVTPGVIRATAENAERRGFSTLWAAEHAVLFERQDSKYPYSPDGTAPWSGNEDWLDPFITLTFAAAATSTIRLATGICLVPEHNPLILAKEIATLDRLAGGRFALGVGIGWCAEEFAALGIQFERRAQRTREYIEVMRRLWSEETTSFHGEFVNFDRGYSNPKPPQGAKLPILFGGESGPALKRVAEYGNGWYGFNLDPAEARAKIEKLQSLVRQNRRDPKEIEIIVSPYSKRIVPDDLKRYRDAGAHEVVILANPPVEPSQIAGWMERLAHEWVEPASKLS